MTDFIYDVLWYWSVSACCLSIVIHCNLIHSLSGNHQFILPTTTVFSYRMIYDDFISSEKLGLLNIVVLFLIISSIDCLPCWQVFNDGVYDPEECKLQHSQYEIYGKELCSCFFIEKSISLFWTSADFSMASTL